MGLGIISKRDPAAFSKAIMKIDANYEYFVRKVDEFSPKLKWDFIAEQHRAIYQAPPLKEGIKKL
jgi:hypothetical protein